MDQWFSDNLSQFSQSKQDYDQLYNKTKVFSHLAQTLYDKGAKWKDWKKNEPDYVDSHTQLMNLLEQQEYTTTTSALNI